MTDDRRSGVGVPLSQLPPEEKAKRSSSFGAVAATYERFRPGPPMAAVDWIIPSFVETAVDLGAGTGALSRLLVNKADKVIAVEPDDRMRAILEAEVPGVEAVNGRGESMPIPDGEADAVVASTSWHWMDTVPTLNEVGRVLTAGGVLGAMWSGPDPEGPFLAQARVLLAQQSDGPDASESTSEFASFIMSDADRPNSKLEIPAGVPFDQPEQKNFTWDVALDADELIGLLGTFSWILTMSEEAREGIKSEARRLLTELLGVEGEVTVDVAFRCEAFRSRRHG